MLADAVLIQATLAGDVAAFGTLVTRYERSLCAIARGIIRDRQLAEDAVQDAFLAAYQALPNLHNPAAFVPWLTTIARRRARDLAVRRPQLATLTDDALPDPSSDPDTDALPFDQERLLAALVALPEPERHALMLRHFDDHNAASIAHITGESVSTITKRISRGHARLRDMLKEYLP